MKTNKTNSNNAKFQTMVGRTFRTGPWAILIYCRTKSNQ